MCVGSTVARPSRDSEAEKNLTLNKAIDLAQRMETATKNVKELSQTRGKEASTASEVNQVTFRP